MFSSRWSETHPTNTPRSWVLDASSISRPGDVREGSRLRQYLELVDQQGDGDNSVISYRALGEGYLSTNPFPSRTETEVMCAFQEKSVHRVCFIWEQLDS